MQQQSTSRIIGYFLICGSLFLWLVLQMEVSIFFIAFILVVAIVVAIIFVQNYTQKNRRCRTTAHKSENSSSGEEKFTVVDMGKNPIVNVIELTGNFSQLFGLKHILNESHVGRVDGLVTDLTGLSLTSRKIVFDNNKKILEKILTTKMTSLRHYPGGGGFNFGGKITWILPPLPEIKTNDGLVWRSVRPISCLQLEWDPTTKEFEVYFIAQAKVILKSSRAYAQIDQFEKLESLNVNLVSSIANINLPEDHLQKSMKQDFYLDVESNH